MKSLLSTQHIISWKFIIFFKKSCTDLFIKTYSRNFLFPFSSLIREFFSICSTVLADRVEDGLVSAADLTERSAFLAGLSVGRCLSGAAVVWAACLGGAPTGAACGTALGLGMDLAGEGVPLRVIL